MLYFKLHDPPQPVTPGGAPHEGSCDLRETSSSISALAYRGTLVSVGVAARAGSNIEARDLWAKNNTLRGVFLGGALPDEYPRVHAMIAKLIARVGTGELRVVIDRTFPLAAAAAAHAYIEAARHLAAS